MNHSMSTSQVAMRAVQHALDVIAHNIANADRYAFKRQEVVFSDVLTNRVAQHGESERGAGRWTLPGITESGGTNVASVRAAFGQGALVSTDRSLDVALDGQALVAVVGARDGATSWVRGGSWQLSPVRDGLMLTTASGDIVQSVDNAPIVIPPNHTVRIDERGVVIAEPQGGGLGQEIAVLNVRSVLRFDVLERVSDDRFVLPQGVQEGDVFGAPTNVTVRAGMLERSNVVLVQEMSALMLMQRAYQLNARALISADAMSGMVNNLRG
ncbi:MAG: flagellar hook-basal body protein [Paenibacillaceae bacterium]|nr:flagellar hook-basal body protein [Paenibacillaceae bacterium]